MTLSATDPSAVRTGVDVYGLRIALAGWDEAIDAVRRDFAWFEASGSKLDDPHLQVTVEQREPDFDRFGQPTARPARVNPPSKASFTTVIQP